MKLRTERLNGDCTHREYYAQFVTQQAIDTVSRLIGKQRILNSTHEAFADIPLSEWDALPHFLGIGHIFEQVGDSLTLSGYVCVYKEAARQLLERTRNEAKK